MKRLLVILFIKLLTLLKIDKLTVNRENKVRELIRDIKKLRTEIDVIEKSNNKLLQMLEDGTLYKREKPIRWKCSKCGYIHEGTEPPAKCPSCQHPKEYFEPECL